MARIAARVDSKFRSSLADQPPPRTQLAASSSQRARWNCGRCITGASSYLDMPKIVEARHQYVYIWNCIYMDVWVFVHLPNHTHKLTRLYYSICICFPIYTEAETLLDSLGLLSVECHNVSKKNDQMIPIRALREMHISSQLSMHHFLIFVFWLMI